MYRLSYSVCSLCECSGIPECFSLSMCLEEHSEAGLSPLAITSLFWFLVSRGCRGLLLQCCCCCCCCCKQTSVDGVPPVRGFGFWSAHQKCELTSAPVLGLNFYPIRLLIRHPASRGLPALMVMALNVGFCSSVSANISPSLRFTSGFRLTTPLLFHRVSCLLDCMDEHAW